MATIITPATHVVNYVRRPALGTSGQAVRIRSNYFEVTQLPNNIIHHYDVTITPDVPPPVNRKIFHQVATSYGASHLNDARAVYDGRKNIFSARAFAFESHTFEVTLASDVARVLNPARPPPKFKVKIRKAASINLEELHRYLNGRISLTNNCLTAIMALDVLIRHQPAMLSATVGRSFYTPVGSQALSGPLDVWLGYYQSARPTLGRMMINMDVSATAFFRPGPLLEMVAKIANVQRVDDLRRTSPPINWRAIEKVIKSLRFTVNHRRNVKRSFKVLGLTTTAAKDTKFMQQIRSTSETAGPEAQVETDVVTYFKQAYNITINFPMLPCVKVGQSIVLPIELCFVLEGQRYLRKLDKVQTAEMIRFNSQPPQARFNKIKDGLEILKYNDNEFLKDFGMKVSNEMVQVNARVLPAPTVCYHSQSQNANFVPRDGVWNLRGLKVFDGRTLKLWGIVVFGTERDCPKPLVNGFIQELIVSCTETGMNIPNKHPLIKYSNPHGNIDADLLSVYQQIAKEDAKSLPQLLVCILPNTGVPLYASIKRVTDTSLGVASQCVQRNHIRMPKKPYCANVCLKINAKLGGTNQRLARNMIPFMSEPALILGADVSHPQLGDTTHPSIAALVGSVDAHAARYAATVRVQAARTEMIADLKGMTVELLKSFYNSCGQKPKKIIFYRDGVSEGQFAEVLKSELTSLKAACASLEQGYNPKITFVVVQKRHHTRFFPVHPSNCDRTGNCKPGTVVDQGVVHPFEFDFYLQSHAGILGTSRPAHYHVLFDENRFTSDALQDMTYKLCHLYARCTRSVSYAPPAYYAHIVAARARFHLPGWSDDNVSSEALATTASAYPSVKPNLANVMWFI
ncbi:Eukaryotic translation initiation factor 2C [Mortierella hygrophila]|uniref:Eukaryotic translation initiation factor 2C n=1 Tax=Mortierella hygrophila TaxID=979708 RepID=A0A9P6JZV6_9FUNG|nr:Eukaryotic translation initiation factor 2C [Mortierella hygrophila]